MARRPALSPRQKTLVALVRKSQRERGTTPTIRELATAMGITFQSVSEHLKALERKRMIVRHGLRAITLIEANLSQAERVPIYAGKPGVSREVIAAWLDVSLIEVDRDSFGFVLGDDAGGEPGLRAGDYMFARPTAPSDGDLTAVFHDGRMALRRVPPDGLTTPVYGRVVGMFRQL